MNTHNRTDMTCTRCLSKAAVLLCMIILLTACTQIPEYPLTKDVIEKSCAEAGLNFEVEPMDLQTLGSSEDGVLKSGFYLNNKAGEQWGILSGKKSGDRIIHMAFPLMSEGIITAIKIEESSKAFELASALFGGFASKDELYDKFLTEYKSKTNITPDSSTVVSKNLETYVWSAKISNIQCEIALLKNHDTGEVYLFKILITTNKGVFFD